MAQALHRRLSMVRFAFRTRRSRHAIQIISFRVDGNEVNCLSFSPDGRTLLICMEDEVQIWSLETRQKLGHIPSFGSLDASFSNNGRFIIDGNTNRERVWDATTRKIVFDCADTGRQNISFSVAKDLIQNCGPLAHRMWPTYLRTTGPVPEGLSATCARTELTVDNTYDSVSYHVRPRYTEYVGTVFLLKSWGMLEIYKMQN